MANTLHLPPVDALPLPTAPQPEGERSIVLVNNGTPALATSEWLCIIDAGFQTDAAGTAFQVYDCLKTLTADGSAFMAGLSQYGVQSCVPVAQSWDLDIPLSDGGSQRVTTVRNGFAWISSMDSPHIKPSPDYADLDAIVSPYTAPGRVVILVTHMQPEWEGFAYGQQYVAFHTVDHNGNPFAVVVYPPDTAAIGLPDWTPQQVMTSALSHELAEMLTDPKADGSGWYSANPADGESDDMSPCLWHPVVVPSADYPDRFSYWCQGYWRNDTGACWDGTDGLHEGHPGPEETRTIVLASTLAPAQLQVVRNLVAIAQKYETVPPLLLLAVTLQESSWQEDAYNGDDPGGGSYGPFQLNQSGAAHPGTAAIAVNPWYDYGFPEIKDRWRSAYFSIGGDAAWAVVPNRPTLLELFAPSAQGSVPWPAGLGALRYQQAVAALEAVS